MNRAWETAYGERAQDILSLNIYDIFPQCSSEVREAHRRALSGETVMLPQLSADLGNSDESHIQRECWPWHDDTGAIAGIIVLARDVTRQVKAERYPSAESRLARFRLIAAMSGEGPV